MSRYVDNGQYQIGRLVLQTNTITPTEIDLQPLMADMTIYESIYSQTLSGNITIIDSFNLVKEYSLGNQEKIFFEFNTAGIDKVQKVEMVCYKVSEPYRVSEHSSGHTLYFCSEEALNSVRRRVFFGVNQEISLTVNTLYERMKRATNPKPIEISQSRNIEQFVFTGNDVIDAIKMIEAKAIAQNGGKGYVFFEDLNTFKFVTLEELYSQEPVVEYGYKNSGVFNNVKNASEESFNAYQDYEVIPPLNFMERLNDGHYGSSWMEFSIMDKSLQVVNYNAKDSFEESKSLGKAPLPIDKDYNTEYSDRFVLNYNSSRSASFDPYVLGEMAKSRASTFSVSIGLFGDSSLRVGQTCKASIPNWSPLGLDPTNPDRDVFSGKFLIAEIKHMFTNRLYTQRIKLIKDAYEEDTK